jgi:hypothetical protein
MDFMVRRREKRKEKIGVGDGGLVFGWRLGV